MKRLFFSLFLLVLFSDCFTQKREISIKDYYSDAEFFFLAEDYSDALHDYFEIYNRGYNENANINYKIGVCYLNIPGQKEKSIEYLLKASEKVSDKYSGISSNEQNSPKDVFLYLGNAYRIIEELDKAVEMYNKFIDLTDKQNVEEKTYALKQIEACKIAREYINNPREMELVNLGKIINTSTSEHNCVVSGDGTTMVFMRKLPFYEAVFMSKKRGKNWSRPVNITSQIMSDGDQYVTGLSFDGTRLLLTKIDEFDSDIYQSEYLKGQWSKSKPISKSINGRFWESHASFSKGGDTIYFTSNRKGGYGEMDIYYSNKQENGNWSEPVNLGPNINTDLNEDAPFITSDGQSLYFSSQGHMNIGGYDYFVSHYSDTGWQLAENLKYPLSTTDEDLFFFPYSNGAQAYIQKILSDGQGIWDLYFVDLEKEPEIKELAEKIEDIEEGEDVGTDEVERIDTVIKIEIKPILFDFDNYILTDQAKQEIIKYIQLLKSNEKINLIIIGHTDALGPAEYNKKLSERRANTVSDYIISKGISSERIKAEGRGEEQFVAVNINPDGTDNPVGRKYNRRVEFDIKDETGEIIIKRISNIPDSFRIQKK